MSIARGRSLAAEDRDLAARVGARLRTARLRAGLTQRQVAEGRYTRAYVSALETGQIKPSVAALRFLAERLGTTPAELLSEEGRRWSRLEADLRLAAGDWQPAADAFTQLLEAGAIGTERAESLLGLAEALCRLDRPHDAVRLAAEARDLLGRAGAIDGRRMATYWLAAAHHQAENPAQARILLEELLAEDRGHDPLHPDLHVRVLIALAMVLSHAGEPKQALLLLEEARGLSADLDDRRRATLLFSLAIGYRSSGDTEAAVRAGLQSLALYRAARAGAEAASLENELALIYLQLGNVAEADRFAQEAHRHFERLRDVSWLAHVVDTEARVALARNDAALAVECAGRAVDLARQAANRPAEVDALLTGARAERVRDDGTRAARLLEEAADLARGGPPGRLREVLTEWADLLAGCGEHARAYELTREALALG